MTYKQLETSREIRLWVGQIIVPAVTIASGYFAIHPEKVDEMKQKLKERRERKKFAKMVKNAEGS